VWDQDEETAIQSPRGGTKIAWGGPPVTPSRSPARQRFEIAVLDADPDDEVDRLLALGATPRAVDGGRAIVLADPDGVEFSLLTE
jgi:hypothetical protein